MPNKPPTPRARRSRTLKTTTVRPRRPRARNRQPSALDLAAAIADTAEIPDIWDLLQDSALTPRHDALVARVREGYDIACLESDAAEALQAEIEALVPPTRRADVRRLVDGLWGAHHFNATAAYWVGVAVGRRFSGGGS